MLDISLGVHRTCDGVSRRDFLRVGALTAFGLSMPGLLQAQAAARANGRNAGRRDVSIILIWLNGGPSHIDTFDPKPDAPQEVRGPFKAIGTNVAGIQLSEHLPKLARQADKFSIIRSVTSPDGTHETATHYLLTGYPFNPAIEYPAYGSVLAREKGYQNGLPPYVMMHGLPFNHGHGGYMGPVYNPFMIHGDPNDPNFSVRDVMPPHGIDLIRLERRRLLRDALDEWQRDRERAHGAARTVDEFYERAFGLMTSPAAKKAFSLKDEPDRVREAYGRTVFGQSCLLARRLVEAGVRCVTINMGGWDTHENNFNALKGHLLPMLDTGYAALLQDLHDRGLLESTMVVCMGEFGRTPIVNAAAGRDHWPGAISVCMGGGGVKTGIVVGSTNDRAEYPKERPLRVEDVAATIYRALGIDYEKEYISPEDRPIKINYDGSPIKELV
ncbi:MAG: DUF1501 domain-containing protein [Chloroherpetonaceae bacterium]|nr:DUF1501 domain-containing protein [Chthonomonadaceae bacterium]MDW8208334.1 DUF1501 domain-containing protein [Chloroherpetonaceae bacterium]